MNMRESFEAWIQSRYPEYPLDVELGNCGRPDSYTCNPPNALTADNTALANSSVMPSSLHQRYRSKSA